MPFLLPEIRCWQEIWPEFTCLRVSENHFGNPETSKIQTNNMKARPDTCCPVTIQENCFLAFCGADLGSQQTLWGRKALGSVSVHLSLYDTSILKLQLLPVLWCPFDYGRSQSAWYWAWNLRSAPLHNLGLISFSLITWCFCFKPAPANILLADATVGPKS